MHKTAEAQQAALKEALEAEVARVRKRSLYVEFTDDEEDDGAVENENAEVNADESEEDEAREDTADDRPSIYPDYLDESTAVRIQTWIRLLSVSTRASRALAVSRQRSGWLSEIRLEYLEAKKSSINYRLNWTEVLDKLYLDLESAKKINRYLTKNHYLRFGKKMIQFKGRAHCEAMSCALCFEIKNKTGTV